MWYQEAYTDLKPRRCPMPVPIICLDQEICQFAERFRELFSKPQYQYFVTVLLGLMECEGNRTLTGLLRQSAEQPSLAGLSRFLSEAPGQAARVADRWLRHFREEMQPQVTADLQRQRQGLPKHRGRPKQPVGSSVPYWGRLHDPEAQRQ